MEMVDVDAVEDGTRAKPTTMLSVGANLVPAALAQLPEYLP
jgi:hypothetical protein